jgi:hypothetical protein
MKSESTVLYFDARRHYDDSCDRNGVRKPHVLSIRESRVLGRIFGMESRTKVEKEVEEMHITESLIIFSFHDILLG